MLKRIYRRVDELEEVAYNMWGEVDDRHGALTEAIAFTGDHELYGEYMRRVIAEWPNSCEYALTDSSLNQKAWIGHAACAMAMKCPEDIVREAWGYLTNEQRILANNQAAYAISLWRDNYAKDRRSYRNMESAMLFERHSRRGSGQAIKNEPSSVLQSDSLGYSEE